MMFDNVNSLNELQIVDRMKQNSPYPIQSLEINPSSLLRVDMLAPVSYQGEGFIQLADFPRLLAESASVSPGDGFDCQIVSLHRDGRPFMEVKIRGRMAIACQRCLDPMALELEIQKTYVFLRTEVEADQFPMDRDDEEAMVASTHFNLLEAIEDEILLALPHAPKHPVGQCQLRQIGADLEKPNPFKVLKNLKK
ncbi:DUF177 domain-containing protein [Polynucleobacter sp. HIN6]|uniref:YceD family protein n=1 Tax=Polynucleobacter sp. HIN6 TaxID=3047865 RepID=UPI002572D0C7|nr:DUF177 domain-containing protein [Polynucleobacter sp. HIN6]BEI34935.1 DUF177 domain-containing protein [Polynucleobacter sp. HIN6]